MARSLGRLASPEPTATRTVNAPRQAQASSSKCIRNFYLASSPPSGAASCFLQEKEPVAQPGSSERFFRDFSFNFLLRLFCLLSEPELWHHEFPFRKKDS